MAFQAGDTVPYGPPSAAIEFITRYRDRGMPTPITVEVLERAGISGALTRRTLQSLKLLGILDSENNPTPEFEAATRAPDGQFKERLSDLILGLYSEVLTFADPATDSYDRVKDAFRAFNPRGQQDRQITMFLGLLEFVGVSTAAAVASRKRSEPVSPGAVKQARPSPVGKGSKPPKYEDESAPADDGLPPGLLGLLKQVPRNGEGWPTSRRDEFLAAFRAVLNFTIPIREDAPASDPSETQEAR